LECLCQKKAIFISDWSPGGVFKQWTPGGVENLVDSSGLHWSPPEFIELGVRVRVRIGSEAI